MQSLYCLARPLDGGTDDEVGYGRLPTRSGAGLSAKMGFGGGEAHPGEISFIGHALRFVIVSPLQQPGMMTHRFSNVRPELRGIGGTVHAFAALGAALRLFQAKRHCPAHSTGSVSSRFPRAWRM